MARIVLVEDYPGLLKLFAKLLRQAGHEVVSAASVDEAVPLCREAATNLVITDWILAGAGTGGDLARELNAKCPDLKVVVITGLPEDPTGSAAALPNIVKVLMKPFESHDLLEAVTAALS